MCVFRLWNRVVARDIVGCCVFFCFRSAFNENSANNFNAFEFLGRSIENALKNVVQFNLAVVVAAVAVAVECFVGTVVTDRKG